jgi:hypothetical protein
MGFQKVASSNLTASTIFLVRTLRLSPFLRWLLYLLPSWPHPCNFLQPAASACSIAHTVMKSRAVQFITIIVGSFVAFAAEAPSFSLPAAKLLNRYKQALDATRSMIEFYEEVDDACYRLLDGPEAPRARRLARGQHRVDGKRLYRQNYYWGGVNSQLRNVPETNSRYSLGIEAGLSVDNSRPSGLYVWN